MTRFNVIYSTGHYYFQFMNGDTHLLASEAYNFKSSCQNGISSVKSRSLYSSAFHTTDEYLNYRFVMKGANGEIIGRSVKGYATAAERDRVIQQIKDYAYSAPIYDLT